MVDAVSLSSPKRGRTLTTEATILEGSSMEEFQGNAYLIKRGVCEIIIRGPANARVDRVQRSHW